MAAPPKIKITVSLVVLDRSPIGYLHRRHIKSLWSCVLCGSHPESSTHIFLSYPFALRIWAPFVVGLNLPLWLTSLCHMWEVWQALCIPGATRKIWDIRVHAIVWYIWLERYSIFILIKKRIQMKNSLTELYFYSDLWWKKSCSTLISCIFFCNIFPFFLTCRDAKSRTQRAKLAPVRDGPAG